MADEHHHEEHHHEEPKEQSLMEKISEKIHAHDDSSSVSDHEKKKNDASSSIQSKIYRLFGREKPVHRVLGGGKRRSNWYLFVLLISSRNDMEMGDLI